MFVNSTQQAWIEAGGQPVNCKADKYVHELLSDPEMIHDVLVSKAARLWSIVTSQHHVLCQQSDFVRVSTEKVYDLNQQIASNEIKVKVQTTGMYIGTVQPIHFNRNDSVEQLVSEVSKKELATQIVSYMSIIDSQLSVLSQQSAAIAVLIQKVVNLNEQIASDSVRVEGGNGNGKRQKTSHNSPSD